VRKREQEMPREIALEWLAKNETRIIAISDKIWELAEVGLQEHESSRLLVEETKKAGFKVDLGVAGMPTAFVGSYGSGKPVIGVLAEYDALPGVSQKAQSTREPLKKGAPGHGCGHNLFGAGSLSRVPDFLRLFVYGLVSYRFSLTLTSHQGIWMDST
jgi:aminobenzoyl-glutamate utilization protein B